MMDINLKLSKVKINSDEKSHLEVDNEICKNCKLKICTKICPAKVYEWTNAQEKLIINYENCLECGACRIACEKKCLNWKYPQKGVTFKKG